LSWKGEDIGNVEGAFGVSGGFQFRQVLQDSLHLSPFCLRRSSSPFEFLLITTRRCCLAFFIQLLGLEIFLVGSVCCQLRLKNFLFSAVAAFLYFLLNVAGATFCRFDEALIPHLDRTYFLFWCFWFAGKGGFNFAV